MRAFIDLEIPKEIKKELGKIQKDLSAVGAQARWVKPEITHLTLAFLGSITPDKVGPISQTLTEVASQIKPIKLFLTRIDCFPSSAKARIIFLSLGGELDKLNALALKIRKKLKKEKIYFDEKPFVTHLTLGRIKKRQNLTTLQKQVKIKKIKFVSNKIVLIQSTLTPSGPIHKNLKSFFLLSPKKTV